MFAALGRSVHRHRRVVIVLWSLAFAAGLTASVSVASQLKGGGFTDPSSPSQQGQRQMQERLGFGPASLTVVFGSETLSARGPAFRAQVEEALSGVEAADLDGLTGVRTAWSTGDASFFSRDGMATFVVLEFDGTSEEVQAQIPALRRALKPTELTTLLTGDPAVYAELEQRSADDLRTAESYTIPVAILVLVLIFGTLVAAALPVIGGGMAVTVTLGIFWLVAQALDISVFALNVATLLGLAVGIDYALFMVGRFREELAAGAAVAEAVETTVATAGRSIFFSGITVVVGPARPHDHPVHVAALDGPGRRARRARERPRRPDAAAGAAGGPRATGELAARDRAQERQRGVLEPLERLGHAASGARAARAPSHLWPSSPGRYCASSPTSPGRPPCRATPRRGRAMTCSRNASTRPRSRPSRCWSPGRATDDPFAPANLARLYAYGRQLEAVPGVDRVTSIVTLPGMDSAAGAAAFWQGVEAAAAASPREDAAPRTEASGLPGPRPGHVGRRAGEGRPEACRGDHGAGDGPAPRRARGAADLRGGPGAGRRTSRRPAARRARRPSSPAPP